MPLDLTVTDNRATLTLANPAEGNRLNAAFMRALGEAVATLSGRSDYRTLLVRAEGPHFCVGGAIDEFLGARSFKAHIEETLADAHALFARFAALPVPIVTAVQGAAAGGGLGFALSGDVVIAAESAVFRSAYPAIGVSPDLGTSFQVIRRAGPTFAAEFLMSNRKLAAREALAARLINETVPHADLPARAEETAARLAEMPRASLAAIKRLVNAPGADLAAHMRLEHREMLVCAGSPDAAEGIAAFAEKRKPRFA